MIRKVGTGVCPILSHTEYGSYYRLSIPCQLVRIVKVEIGHFSRTSFRVWRNPEASS